MKRIQYKRYALGLASILTVGLAMGLTSGAAYATGGGKPECDEGQQTTLCRGLIAGECALTPGGQVPGGRCTCEGPPNCTQCTLDCCGAGCVPGVESTVIEVPDSEID